MCDFCERRKYRTVWNILSGFRLYGWLNIRVSKRGHHMGLKLFLPRQKVAIDDKVFIDLHLTRVLKDLRAAAIWGKIAPGDRGGSGPVKTRWRKPKRSY